MVEKKKKTMVGLGEILWDMLPEGKQLGGAPANFACHATQLGNEGVIVSSVGNDADGADILNLLERKQVSHLISTSEDYPTGIVSVDVDHMGVPAYTIHEDAAWDHLPFGDTHKRLAESADVICYGSLASRHPESAHTIAQCIEATSPTCVRIFDVNLRQNYFDGELLHKLLKLSTVLKLNDEELLVVSELLFLSGSETTLLELLQHAYDLDLVILTKGEYGSRLFSMEKGDSILEGHDIKVVDTVGAGDSFTAAVATGLSLDMPLDKIHHFASNIAAYVCSQAGATPELPQLGELVYKH